MDRISNPDKNAIKLLSFGHFMSDIYGGFITPIMPLIAAKLDISLGLVGLLLTISNLSSSLSQPFFGYISDFLSKRLFILSGILVSAFFISLIGYTHNALMLGLVLFFGSMGVGLFHPQATAFAGYFSGKEINHYMGIFTACGTIGFAIGPLFSSFLVEMFGLNSTIIAIIPGLVVAFLIYKKLPKIPIRLNKTHSTAIWPTLTKIKRILIPLSLISITRSISVMSFTIFMPFLWRQNNYSVLTIGTLIALFSVLGGISSYLGGKISKTTGEKPLLVFSLLPAIPSLFGALYFVDKFPLFSNILFLLAGFVLTVSMTINFVIAQKAAPENMGVVSGIIGGFSWGIAGLLLTPIGFMANKYGIVPVLTIIAFTPILGTISALFLPKKYA